MLITFIYVLLFYFIGVGIAYFVYKNKLSDTEEMGCACALSWFGLGCALIAWVYAQCDDDNDDNQYY